MKLLILIFCILNFPAFSQTITEIDNNNIKIKNDGYEYIDGNSYYFKANDKMIKTKAGSTELNITNFTVTKGLENLTVNQKVTRLRKKGGLQKPHPSSTEAPGNYNFKKHRFSFGLMYLKSNDLTLDDPSSPTINGKSLIDGFSGLGLNLEYRYLFSYLHIGLALSGGQGETIINNYDANGQLDETTTADALNSNFDIFLGPQYKGFSLSLGYSYNVFGAEKVGKISFAGSGFNLGLGYEYFFGPKWGVSLTGKYINYSTNKVLVEDAAGNKDTIKFEDGSSLDSNRISVGLNAIIKW